MKSSGIVQKFDEPRRILVPIELRTHEIVIGDHMESFVSGRAD